MLKISVKALDGSNSSFEVDEEMTVMAFKEHIADSINITAELQKIIYQGRVLPNDKILKDFDLDGKALHVVSSAARSESGPQRANDNSANAANSPHVNQTGATMGQARRRGMQSVDVHINVSSPIHLSPTQNLSRFDQSNKMLDKIDSLLTNLEKSPSDLGASRNTGGSGATPGGGTSSGTSGGSRSCPTSLPTSSTASAVAAAAAAGSGSNATGSSSTPASPAVDPVSDSDSGFTCKQLSTLLGRLTAANDRLRPISERYKLFLDDNSTETFLRSQNGHYKQFREVLHLLSHIQHSMSDFSVDFSMQPSQRHPVLEVNHASMPHDVMNGAQGNNGLNNFQTIQNIMNQIVGHQGLDPAGIADLPHPRRVVVVNGTNVMNELLRSDGVNIIPRGTGRPTPHPTPHPTPRHTAPRPTSQQPTSVPQPPSYGSSLSASRMTFTSTPGPVASPATHSTSNPTPPAPPPPNNTTATGSSSTNAEGQPGNTSGNNNNPGAVSLAPTIVALPARVNSSDSRLRAVIRRSRPGMVSMSEVMSRLNNSVPGNSRSIHSIVPQHFIMTRRPRVSHDSDRNVSSGTRSHTTADAIATSDTSATADAASIASRSNRPRGSQGRSSRRSNEPTNPGIPIMAFYDPYLTCNSNLFVQMAHQPATRRASTITGAMAASDAAANAIAAATANSLIPPGMAQIIPGNLRQRVASLLASNNATLNNARDNSREQLINAVLNDMPPPDAAPAANTAQSTNDTTSPSSSSQVNASDAPAPSTTSTSDESSSSGTSDTESDLTFNLHGALVTDAFVQGLSLFQQPLLQWIHENRFISGNASGEDRVKTICEEICNEAKPIFHTICNSISQKDGYNLSDSMMKYFRTGLPLVITPLLCSNESSLHLPNVLIGLLTNAVNHMAAVNLACVQENLAVHDMAKLITQQFLSILRTNTGNLNTIVCDLVVNMLDLQIARSLDVDVYITIDSKEETNDATSEEQGETPSSAKKESPKKRQVKSEDGDGANSMSKRSPLMNCRQRIGGIAGPLAPRLLDLQTNTNLEVLPNFYSLVDGEPKPSSSEWQSRVPESWVDTIQRDERIGMRLRSRVSSDAYESGKSESKKRKINDRE